MFCLRKVMWISLSLVSQNEIQPCVFLECWKNFRKSSLGLFLIYMYNNICLILQKLSAIPLSAFCGPETKRQFEKYIRFCFIKVSLCPVKTQRSKINAASKTAVDNCCVFAHSLSWMVLETENQFGVEFSMK